MLGSLELGRWCRHQFTVDLLIFSVRFACRIARAHEGVQQARRAICRLDLRQSHHTPHHRYWHTIGHPRSRRNAQNLIFKCVTQCVGRIVLG